MQAVGMHHCSLFYAGTDTVRSALFRAFEGAEGSEYVKLYIPYMPQNISLRIMEHLVIILGFILLE